MATTIAFSLCSLLMAALFGYSASVQLNDPAGFWSLDVSERVVREKTGSGLVLISMILHLEASSEPKHSKMPRKRREFPRSVEYGMASLVIFSLGLPFVFFVIHDGEMKFDHIKEQNNVKSF
ncbi:hypothetical protein BDE02_07G030400 [Populus trichocarpa]|nr:hypothetical protein BDE02_07G030400 [Populus trichocarpa]